MVAGEASAICWPGLLLERPARALARWRVLGIGGPQMAAQGFEAWWPSDKLAVRGYVEVLRHYREISASAASLRERLLREPPDAFIGVERPTSTSAWKRGCKAAGIQTVHFVCPSIWAWRGGRVKKIGARAATTCCACSRSSRRCCARTAWRPAYVGHPLADAIPLEPPRDAARDALGLGASDAVVAVLPGSRRCEIQYIAPLFLQAAARACTRQRPGPALRAAGGARACAQLVEPLVARACRRSAASSCSTAGRTRRWRPAT